MTDTAPTAEALAKELDRVGLRILARRARQNEFHDYLSPHALPEHVLADALAKCAQHFPGMSTAILGIRQDVINGKFDASREEGEEWAKSPEGKATFDSLVQDIMKGKKK